MNRVFRIGKGSRVPDGTIVHPFLNPTDSNNDLPIGLFDDVSIALGEIGPGQSSKIQVHPLVTVIIWVVHGDLRLRMKDTDAAEPYCLELRAEDGALAQPGTFFQLINPGSETCRLIYVVTPPYVFLETQGQLVYDDAIVVDCDWETLAAQQYQAPGMGKPGAMRAKRRKAIEELSRRKGSAKQL